MSQQFHNPNRPLTAHGIEEPRVNLWRLPNLVSVAARPVTYPRPRVYYVGTERRETRQAVELQVETSEPIPVRAVTPLLLIGETAIPDYTTEGATLYRFVAYEPDRLEPGAAIRWGWPESPKTLVATRFRFSLDSAPPLVARANTGRRSDTGFGEDLAEQAQPDRFRTVIYDQESLHYLDGWTRATGPSAVYLIDRPSYDPIRADGAKRGRELDRFVAQKLKSGRGAMDPPTPMFVLDPALATVPLNRASRGDWDDLMIAQLIGAAHRLTIQRETDQWKMINRLFAQAEADARKAAQQNRAAFEFVAYLVLDTIKATLTMVQATNVTMRDGHAVIPLSHVRGTDRQFVPGTDPENRVIGDVHTHYLLDPLIDLNHTSVGTTIRSTQISLHSGVSDIDVASARDSHIVVYAVDSKHLHRANPDGSKNDELSRSGDVLREALRVFGGEVESVDAVEQATASAGICLHSYVRRTPRC